MLLSRLLMAVTLLSSVAASAYTGSDTCRDCHASEHETWRKSPHGTAMKTLAAREKENDPDCLKCHTTAMGKPGL